MSGRPQLKGVVLQVMIRKPKKPNSAQRKCCRVRLSTGKEVIAYNPPGGRAHIAGTQCGIGSRGTDAGFARGQRPSDTGEIRLWTPTEVKELVCCLVFSWFMHDLVEQLVDEDV